MQEISPYPYVLLRRVVAFLYDCLLLIAVFFVVAGVAVIVNNYEAVTHPVWYLALWFVGFCYFTWFWRRDGRTLGLQAWKLHVKSDRDSMLSFKQCVIRYVSGTALFGVTYLSIPFRRDRKALHDVLSYSNIYKKFK